MAANAASSLHSAALFASHNRSAISLSSDHKCFLLHFQRPLLSSLSSSHSLSSSSSATAVPRVSTAPVEYASPTPELDFREEIARLRRLKSKLSKAATAEERDRVMDSDSRVSRFFNSSRKGFSRVLESAGLDSYEMYLIKCVIAAGQEHVISFGLDHLTTAEREGGFDFEAASAKSSLKSAFYMLVDMIEKWDTVDGGAGNGKMEMKTEMGNLLREEEIGALRMLLKTLKEMESFYDCIGGIIG